MAANYIKQEMFKKTIAKLNRACNSGYFYEAIMLDYNLVEDRLNEFLMSVGVVNASKDGLIVTKKARNSIRKLLSLPDTAQFGIGKISIKLTILQKLVDFDKGDIFLEDLHSILIKKVGAENINSLIQKIENWKNERNVFVHGLMSRVPDECDETVKELAFNGKLLFRELDKYCRRIEKCGIRKKYRIQPYNN